MMRNILRHIRLMLGRAVVNLVDDAGGLQRVQLTLLDGETRESVERLQEYGFTSHPLPGSEAVVAFIGGDRGRGVIIGIDDRRYRLHLVAGEVALYDDLGNVIHFKRDRILIDAVDLVEVVAPEVLVRASTKVRLETPLVEATQNMTVGGTLQVTGMATVGGLASTGAAGASSVSGDIAITGGDVTADGISLKTHVHGGVTTGTGTTGAPQ